MDLFEEYIEKAMKTLESKIALSMFEALGLDDDIKKLIEIMIRNGVPLDAFLKSLKEYDEWRTENGDDD